MQEERDTASPSVDAWDVGEMQDQPAPTPPKSKKPHDAGQGVRTRGNASEWQGLRPEHAKKIDEARMVFKQDQVEVAEEGGGTTTYDLRSMRATTFRDSETKSAAVNTLAI